MTKETTHLLCNVTAALLIHHPLCWPLLHHSPSASDLFHTRTHARTCANSKVSHVTSLNVCVTQSSSVTKLCTKTMDVILHHAFRPLQSRAGVIAAADPSTSTSTSQTNLINHYRKLGGKRNCSYHSFGVWGGKSVIDTALDPFWNGAVEKLVWTNTYLFFERWGWGWGGGLGWENSSWWCHVTIGWWMVMAGGSW